MTTGKVRFRHGERPWPAGQIVMAHGSNVPIGRVLAMSEDEDGLYAEIELTPAAMGVGYGLPEGEEEDMFG